MTEFDIQSDLDRARLVNYRAYRALIDIAVTRVAVSKDWSPDRDALQAKAVRSASRLAVNTFLVDRHNARLEGAV